VNATFSQASRVDISPTDYFEAAWQSFDAVAGTAWRARLDLGPDRVQVDGKGERLRDALLPALVHLQIDSTTSATSSEPRLAVRTWDLANGGVPLPPVHFGRQDQFEHGRVVPLCDERILTIWEPHFLAVTLIDRATGRAVYFTESAERLPYYETAAPLRALWHGWFSREGALPVHGACVGRNGHAVLLTAPGGSGKSTTALLCLQDGFEYLADDWCLVRPSELPTTYSLYNTAKLRPENLHRFPALATRIHNFDRLDEEKATMFLHPHFPSQLRRSARLKAIVVPTVTSHQDTTAQRVSSAEAWHALLKVTVHGVAGSGRELFDLLGKLARCVPVYSLRLGHDLSQVPRAIESILRP
jgi:hypothetical protein